MPLDDRAVLAGILFVLQSGIPWEMLPKELGCGSGMSCWRRLWAWQEAGVWMGLHALLLAKNEDKQRDPEMTQTKKGNQWHFGMKAHIGVDADSGLIHTVECTTAKVADITMMEACLHGEETLALGDRGYHKKNWTIDAFEKEGDLSVLTPTKKPAGGVLTDEQKA